MMCFHPYALAMAKKMPNTTCIQKDVYFAYAKEYLYIPFKFDDDQNWYMHLDILTQNSTFPSHCTCAATVVITYSDWLPVHVHIHGSNQ